MINGSHKNISREKYWKLFLDFQKRNLLKLENVQAFHKRKI